MMTPVSDAIWAAEEVAIIGAQTVSGVNRGYALRQLVVDGEIVCETQFSLKTSVRDMKNALSSAKSAE